MGKDPEESYAEDVAAELILAIDDARINDVEWMNFHMRDIRQLSRAGSEIAYRTWDGYRVTITVEVEIEE